MNEQEFAELAAGHVLNALSVQDESDFATALAEHPEWVHIVTADAATAAALAGGVAQVSAPLGARGELMSLIARTPQSLSAAAHSSPDLTVDDLVAISAAPDRTTSTDVVQTVARRKWMRGVFALAASLALLVTLGFGAALIGQQLGRSPAVIALDRIEDAPDARSAVAALDGGGEATAHWSESLGEAVLTTDDLPQLATGQTYQLWFLRDGGTTIDSAGLFTPDTEGGSTSLLAGTVAAGDAIAVSVEPAGGSAQPTTTPIVTILTEA